MSAALLAAACNFHASTSQANAELNQTAEAVYQDLVAGRDDALVARMSPAVAPAQVRAQLPMLHDMVGGSPPPAPSVVGVRSVASSQGAFYSVRHTYDYTDKTVTADTEFRKEAEGWAIVNFNVHTVFKAGPGTGAAAAPAA
jgi:hypothetical protein